MRNLKQKGKRWLSGLLAVIMCIGMLPTIPGLLTTASAISAADAPEQLKYYACPPGATGFTAMNPATGERYLQGTGIPEDMIARFYVYKDPTTNELYPTMCAAHEKDINSSATWKDPIPVEEFMGYKDKYPGCITPIYPILYASFAGLAKSEYIGDQLSQEYTFDPSGKLNNRQYVDKNLGNGANATGEKLRQWLTDHQYNPGDYWGSMEKGNNSWTYRMSMFKGQGALWLSCAGALDASTTGVLSEKDIEKIAVLDLWEWWADFGRKGGFACSGVCNGKVHDKANTSGWFQEHLQAKISEIKSVIAQYEAGAYDNQYTASMELFVYMPSDGKSQPMVVPVFKPSGSPDPVYVAIKKIDMSGNPLANAVFKVYTDSACTLPAINADTKEEIVLTTGPDGTVTSGPIEQGQNSNTYYALEIEPPPGYTATKKKLSTVAIKPDNTKPDNPAWINGPGGVKNGPPPKKSVVYKVDQFNNGIGPATFSFLSLETGVEQQVDCDESGVLELQWVEPDQPNYIKPGEYAVTELTPPPGCKKTDEVKNIKFWVEEIDGADVGMHSGPLTFVNSRGKTIIVEKASNGEPLPNAVFEIYQNGELLDTFTTGPDGTYTYDGPDGLGLEPGYFYTVYEVEPPDGYLLPTREEDRKREVFIPEGDTDASPIQFHFENYKYPDIKIRKCITGTEIGLDGAVFELRIDGVDLGTKFTSDGGWVTIPYSIYGKFLSEDKDTILFSAREITSPSGYTLDDDNWQEVVYRKGQKTVEFKFEDSLVTPIEVLKLDANTGNILPGAVFALRVDGKDCGSVGPTIAGKALIIPYERYGYILEESDKDEWVFELKEIVPPDGYLISDKSWHQEIVKRGDTKKVFQFQDQKIPEIIIAKRDKETGDYLPGTTFEIKIDGTNFATQKTTGADGKIKLTWEEFGYYLTDIDKEGKGWTVTVTEIKPTTGYNKDKQESSGDYTQTQELKWGQDVMEFEFEDTSYRKIKVKKLDYDTNWPLMGATFHMQSVKLDDKEAQAYDEYLETDENGWVTFENLPNGTYHLTEETPPYGYEPEVWWPDGKKGELTIIVTSEDEPIRTFTAKNKPLSGLKIHKVDSITKQPIAGVLFKITPLPPLSGQAIEPPATDANGNVILQDLLPGTYEIEEISCPKPYICSHEKQRITIDTKHDDYTVTFENVAESMLYILKEDSTTGEPLAGAVFNIHLADGTSIGDTEPTGPNGYTSLSGLKPGSYVVKEVKAPDGHILSDEVKTFTITEEDNGRIIVLRFANDSKSDLWLRKVDFDTGVGLEGAVFKITKADGTVVKENATSDHEGFIQVTGLMPGTYMATETKAPAGYILDETPHPILLETGKTEVIKIQNKKPGGIAIRKVDAKTGEPLAGAKFQLYAIDDTPIGLPKTSGNDGYVRWDSLDPGFYTIKEVEAKEGYVLDTVPVKLEVGEFQTTEYVWKNTQTTTITVTKRDADTLVPLAGATFGVYDLNGKLVDTLVTDINGVATSKQLPLGHYRVVETKAPIDYVLNTEEQLVEVKPDVPVSIEFTNKKDQGLIIHKYDIITKDPLPGAWFELQKLDGTVVLEEFSTDASGTVITSAVPAGEYYLVETKAPTGYVLNAEKILVKIVEGEATVVNVDNVPETIVDIFKTDSVTGDPIPGVEFEIADSKGKVLEYVTTQKDGHAYSQVYEPGEYIVKEVQPAPGYVVDKSEYRVTIKAGENAFLHIQNVPETVIHITKIGATSKSPVAGAVFELYETCGVEPCIKVGQYTTDEYGKATTEPLAPGIYKLKEIIAPAGYVLDETEYEVCVKAGEYNNIIIENQEAAKLIVRKIDSKTGKPIAGAVFKLETASHKLIGMLESDANGEAIFTGLTAGHYLVTETQAPPGYTISSPSEQNVTVEYGKDNYCDFIDAANGSLVVILQDKHTGAYLPGGQFIIIRESDQTVIYDGSTDITGTIVVGNLLPGWYIVKQAYAPDGYTMVDIELKVEILVGTQQTIYFKDETAGLTIEKVDAKNPHQTLEGARFQVIRESDGNVMGEYVTDKSGLALVNGLAPGRYTISELVAPDGYIKMEEPKTVEVKGGVNTHVTFENMPRTSITVNVIDQATRVGIAGCIVEVWHQNGGLVNSYTSDSTGVIETQKLENGFYVLKLVKVADGYSATITETTVEVKDASEVTYTFELVSNGVLKVMSTNSAGTAIAGMKFTLTTYDGKRIGSFTTGTNGTYTFASLAPGQYVVTEDKAPDGYNINTENKVQHIEVKAGGTATVTFAHAQTFGLQIRTTCQQTGAAVAGVKYQVSLLTGEVVGVYTSDAAGIAFATLTPGWYQVTPLEAPSGYTFVDTAPRTIEVMGDRMTTMDFVVTQQSSIRVKVVDGSTNAPLYGVHILLKNGTTNIQEYTTNNEGYINLNQSVVAGGYVLQMISAPNGYIIDSVPKSIDVMNAETTEIVWKLYKDAGQIQVYVTSADYNENLDLPAGTPLQGAVFEIMNADTYIVVGQMISDTSGIAASAGLPIGRYTVKMISAPAYYGINTSFNPEVRLKVNNDVVRVDTTVSSAYLDVRINQQTNTSVTAGSTMRVDITRADNVSDSRLDSFFIHLKVPTDVARITTLEPGIWDGDIWYSISYKTNMQEYRLLAPDLLSSTKYTFDLSTQSLGLMPGEYVTDVRFEFGTVPSSFKLLEKTVYTMYVLSTAPTGYKLINDIEMGGLHNAVSMSTNSNTSLSGNGNSALAGTGGQAVVSGTSGQWVTDISSWSTAIIGKSSGSLPKTGY